MVNEKVQDFPSEKYGKAVLCNSEFGKARGFVSVKNQRILLDGTFSINVPLNGKKFGDEVHLQVYGKNAVVQTRVHEAWDRVEIFFPMSEMDNLISALQKKRREYLESKEKIVSVEDL